MKNNLGVPDDRLKTKFLSEEIGQGFSVDVAQKWEAAFFEQEQPGVRKVALRLGIVMGKTGGALMPMKRLVQLGFGGRFGPGTQYISWLHEQDWVKILDFVIDNPDAAGILNATAPEPVTNQQFLKLMRRTLSVPLALPLPKAVLELGALLIGTETELILKSRCVVPRRLQELGYHFVYPQASQALHDLLTTKTLSYEKA